MAHVVFTPNLERHTSCPSAEVGGKTVGAVLDQVFRENPGLKSYVLDDQGRLRQHVVVFVNGQMIEDRLGLSDSVGDGDELFVMQGLSGG